MPVFRLLLWVLGLGVIGALFYTLLAEDPGYVLLEWRGTSVEATGVAVLGLLLLAWLAIRLVLALLLWPMRAWRRRGERLARRRLADALRASQRGEHALALKLYQRAAQRPRYRVPALTGAVQLATRLGDDTLRETLLGELRQADAQAALIEHARVLLTRGESERACAELAAPLPAQSPALLQLRVEAELAAGRPARAESELKPLRSVLPADEFEALETEVRSALLTDSPDAAVLGERFRALPRAARAQTALVQAYAERARALDDMAAADDAIEYALAKGWDEGLAADYGRSARPSQQARIRQAETWLEEHPDSPALQLALGRLCRIDGLWGKAEAHLSRASLGPHAAEAWEELARALVEQGEDRRGREALQNALAAGRGHASTRLSPRPRMLTAPADGPTERRSSMGVPLLALDEDAREN
ncbi:MAG: hypothetical protein MEQ07_01700 [Aquimonas sp.]|nr:hypothetical protein [Aquimonas sp.]